MEYQFESIGPALRFVVLVCMLVFAVAALGAAVYIAALPGKLARARLHPQADAINVCGWVGLPTGILWAIALVWAFTRSNRIAEPAAPPHQLVEKLASHVSQLEQTVAAFESQLK